MNRKILLTALTLMALVSIVVIVPALQTPTTAAVTEEFSPPTYEEFLLSVAERLKLPETVGLNQIASMRAEIASRRADMGIQEVKPQSPEYPVRVFRREFAFYVVDKSFRPVRTKWEVAPGVYYLADSAYAIDYYVEIPPGNYWTPPVDLNTTILTDTWKRGMTWGTGVDITKPYYLWWYGVKDFPNAGPQNYTASTGEFKLTWDPPYVPDDYQYFEIAFMFLARGGYVNQFVTKPSVSYTLSPRTRPELIEGDFYDMWLNMRKFRVRDCPSDVYVIMGVPEWQSTQNGTYVKNMEPQWWESFWTQGAGGPNPYGTWGAGLWAYENDAWWGGMPGIRPDFPAHWIQLGFQKSDVTPAPDWPVTDPPETGFLYHGSVAMIYSNKGFGMVSGDAPQLTLSPANWNVWVTNGLWWQTVSGLMYYFEEPRSTEITTFFYWY